MRHAVDTVLEERQRAVAGYRRWPIGLSALLHATAIAAIIFLPRLGKGETEPIRYVAVTIMPAQALGSETPGAVETPATSKPTRAPRLEAAVEAPPLVVPAERPQPEKQRTAPPPEPRPAAKARTAPPSPQPQPSQETGSDRAGSAGGNPLGTSQFGGAVGVDNPDFTYGYYIDQMLSMIRSSWVRPPLGGEIEATLHFRIQRDGSLGEVRIQASSGYNQFDLACLRAVQSAAPFPPMPRSYNHDSLGVNLIFR